MRKLILSLAVAIVACGAASEPSWEKSFVSASRATVIVANKTAQGQCSGVVVSPNQVLTNAHCANEGDTLAVVLVQNREFVEATLIARNPDLDLALLKVNTIFTVRAKLSKQDPRIGEDLMSVSWLRYSPFPADEPMLSALIGNVIVTNVDIWVMVGEDPTGKVLYSRRRGGFYIQATGRQGISGGGIWRGDELVGLGSSFNTGTHDIGALPASAIRKFLKKGGKE